MIPEKQSSQTVGWVSPVMFEIREEMVYDLTNQQPGAENDPSDDKNDARKADDTPREPQKCGGCLENEPFPTLINLERAFGRNMHKVRFLVG